MITFQDLVKSLPGDPNQKGLEFEKICKWYLLNSPFYKKQIKNVWLWSEWKDRWSNQDRGIDLIAETKSGEIWAVRFCLWPQIKKIFKKPNYLCSFSIIIDMSVFTICI